MTAMISSIVPAAAGKTSNLQPGSKAARMCKDARALVMQADDLALRGDSNTAFEYYYRAALRIGAARVARSPIGARKRKPQGVWAQLKLVGVSATSWAQSFESYSPLRRRANSFASYQVSDADLEDIRNLVQQFLIDTEFDGVPDPQHPLANLPKAA